MSHHALKHAYLEGFEDGATEEARLRRSPEEVAPEKETPVTTSWRRCVPMIADWSIFSAGWNRPSIRSDNSFREPRRDGAGLALRVLEVP